MRETADGSDPFGTSWFEAVVSIHTARPGHGMLLPRVRGSAR